MTNDKTKKNVKLRRNLKKSLGRVFANLRMMIEVVEKDIYYWPVRDLRGKQNKK